MASQLRECRWGEAQWCQLGPPLGLAQPAPKPNHDNESGLDNSGSGGSRNGLPEGTIFLVLGRAPVKLITFHYVIRARQFDEHDPGPVVLYKNSVRYLAFEVDKAGPVQLRS